MLESEKWERQTANTDHDPPDDADIHITDAFAVTEFEWVHKKQISSYTDANQEVDACVHVDVLQVEAKHAETSSKFPCPSQVIENPQGQGQNLW